MKKERGITLVALIITIIILVILVAVSINAAYNSGIINYAVNGAENYIEGAKREQGYIENANNGMGSVVSKMDKINNTNIDEQTLKSFINEHSDEFAGLVPTLTSNTSYGVASESSDWYGRKAWKAFNGNIMTNNISNCWQATSNASSVGTYIRYQSTTPDTIVKVKVGTWDNNPNNSDKTWTTYIRGSNDGLNWKKISNDVVLTVDNSVITYFEYEINDYTQYQYYEVYFDAKEGDSEYVHVSNKYSCSFMFLQFYGLKDMSILEFYNQKNN